MKRIVLISCVSQKQPYRSRAKDLYISALFKKNLAYAHRLNPDAIYILSAKYGLLALETEIDPYNLTLNTMSAREIQSWAKNVLEQLSQVANLHQDHFIFLAGMKYRKYLLPDLTSYEVPYEGLPIGKQLSYLSKQDRISEEANVTKPSENVHAENRRSEIIGKYALLAEYLAALPIAQQEVTLSFSQIERVLNDNLPPSAQRYRAWWSNETEGSHTQARGWLKAGWFVETVDFTRKQVRLVKRMGKRYC